MIMNYFNPGYHVYQSDICQKVVGEVRETPEGISAGTALASYYFTYTFKWGTLSFDDIKYYINSGKPVQVDIQWKSNHSMVIYGYCEYQYVEKGQVFGSILVVDPGSGTTTSYSYPYFCDNSNFYWRITRYNISGGPQIVFRSIAAYKCRV